MEKKEKSQLPDGITQEMIDDAKKKHGADKVKILDLPLNDEGTEYKSVLAVIPSRNVIGQFRRFMDNNPVKADTILVKACVLSHVDEVLNDDGLFLGAVSGLAELMPVRKAIVKNC